MAKIPSLAALTSLISGFRWDICDADKKSGLYLSSIAFFDSFLGWSYSKQSLVSEYVIEGGSFSTYNKQRQSFQGTATLAKGGLNLPFQKKAFLDKLEEYCDGVKLVSIITPHAVYKTCTINGLAVNNTTEETPSILVVKVEIKEIREVNDIDFSSFGPVNSDFAPTQKLGIKTTFNEKVISYA